MVMSKTSPRSCKEGLFCMPNARDCLTPCILAGVTGDCRCRLLWVEHWFFLNLLKRKIDLSKAKIKYFNFFFFLVCVQKLQLAPPFFLSFSFVFSSPRGCTTHSFIPVSSMSAAMNWVMFIPWALAVFNADGCGCCTRGQGTGKSWWAGGSLCGCCSSFLSPFRWWGGFVQPELPVSLIGVFCFGWVLLYFEKTHTWKTEKAVIGETIPTNSHSGWACYKIHLQEDKSHWAGQKRSSPSPADTGSWGMLQDWGTCEGMLSPLPATVSGAGVPLFLLALDVFLVHDLVELSLKPK